MNAAARKRTNDSPSHKGIFGIHHVTAITVRPEPVGTATHCCNQVLYHKFIEEFGPTIIPAGLPLLY